MQDLKIGDRVLCSAICYPDYTEDGKRVLFRTDSGHFEAVVTGQKRVQLGEYVPGSEGTSSGYDPPDYEPPYLSVTETLLVWCVRRRIDRREIWVADEDLRKADG